MKNALIASMTIIGALIGAGFISGAELVRFFNAPSFLPQVYICTLLIGLSVYALLKCGASCGGYSRLNARLFNRYAFIGSGALTVCSFVSITAMLAGADSLVTAQFGLPQYLPVGSLVLLILCVLIVRRGVGALSRVSAYLVPPILIFIFYFLFKRKGFEYNFAPTDEYLFTYVNVIIYVGMNIFSSAPVIADLGAKKAGVGTAVITAVAIGAAIGVILASIFYEGANAINSPMPLFTVIASGGGGYGAIFFAVSLLGVFTTLTASYYPLACLIEKSKRPRVSELVVCVAAFALARVGLKDIVGYVYPAVGVFGSIWLTALVVLAVKNGILLGDKTRSFSDEKLFKQGNGQIHKSRKHAQKQGRRHNQV